MKYIINNFCFRKKRTDEHSCFWPIYMAQYIQTQIRLGMTRALQTRLGMTRRHPVVVAYTCSNLKAIQIKYIVGIIRRIGGFKQKIPCCCLHSFYELRNVVKLYKRIFNPITLQVNYIFATIRRISVNNNRPDQKIPCCCLHRFYELLQIYI